MDIANVLFYMNIFIYSKRTDDAREVQHRFGIMQSLGAHSSDFVFLFSNIPMQAIHNVMEEENLPTYSIMSKVAFQLFKKNIANFLVIWTCNLREQRTRSKRDIGRIQTLAQDCVNVYGLQSILADMARRNSPILYSSSNFGAPFIFVAIFRYFYEITG